MQDKVRYCRNCGKKTLFRHIAKESNYAGLGPGRVMAALVTFGMTETAWADHYYQCAECGEIKKNI